MLNTVRYRLILEIRRESVQVRYARLMTAFLSAAPVLLALAAAPERPALIVAGEQAPARITRATVLTPAEGPAVVLYAAENVGGQPLDQFTVMAFVFKADGTLKARQTAPARRTLDPHETKYSTLVLDGSAIEATDVIVIGINQAQAVGSDAWWRADLQRSAEAAVPLKKP
jgi:hypothetical protein